MSQDRFKGNECDQCGRPVSIGLRLQFSVKAIYTHKPKGTHPVEDIIFYATFCSKECMRRFLDKFYFESKWEVIENEV